MAARPKLPESEGEALEEAAALEARHGGCAAEAIVELAVERFGRQGAREGALAAVSSFGAESAALLHMVARVDASLPVLFLDTGVHFAETLAYRDTLAAELGLSDLRVIRPQPHLLTAADPDGKLYRSDPDRCCALRKVEPMARAVEPFAAWLTGRKRHQAASRGRMPVFEAVGARLRINPLAGWTTADQAAYMRAHALRQNPLVAQGYPSIGCMPCTARVATGADPRSGRWAGLPKSECGIHLPGLERAIATTSA